MKISVLALASLVAATPVTDVEKGAHSHHHVKVSRFAVPNCLAESHIEKDMSVEAGDCVNFLGKEPGFISFKAKISYNRKGRLGSSDECRLYAYSEKDCKGKKQPMDDMHKYNGACQNQDKLFGRSLYLKCMKKTDLDAADDFDVLEPKKGGIPGSRTTVTRKHGNNFVDKATVNVAVNQPTAAVTVVGTPVGAKNTIVVVKTTTIENVVGGDEQTIKWKTLTTMLPLPSSSAGTAAKATATVTASA